MLGGVGMGVKGYGVGTDRRGGGKWGRGRGGIDVTHVFTNY